MYPSISSDFQTESSPPQPPPPPPPPHQFYNFQDPILIDTGIPVHSANQTVRPNPLPPPTNNPKNFHSPVPWSTGLCSCFDDINSCCLTFWCPCVTFGRIAEMSDRGSTCCLTFWCPCVTFGRIAEMSDRGSTSCGVSAALYTLILCMTGCSCLYSCFYRSKLRGQFFLEESPCADCCVHCCCEECALCQEYRELKNRGFDMSIGWHGNMERQKRLAGNTTAPAIDGGMIR